MGHFISWIRSFFEPSIPARLAAIEALQQDFSRHLSRLHLDVKDLQLMLDILNVESLQASAFDAPALAEELKMLRWALEDLKKSHASTTLIPAEV